FVKLKPVGAPEGLAVIRGKVPANLVKKVSALTGGKIDVIDGRDAVTVDDTSYLATSKSGAGLFGTASLVKPRAAAPWEGPARGKDAPLARLAQVLDARPFLAGYFHPSEFLVKSLENEQDKNAGTEMLKGLETWTLALYHDGMSWSWTDRN